MSVDAVLGVAFLALGSGAVGLAIASGRERLRDAGATTPGRARSFEFAEWQTGRCFPTLRGDFVRSRAHARVADALHRRGLRYEHDAEVAGMRPAFWLPDQALVVECWGADQPKRDAARRRKADAYAAAGLSLVNIEASRTDALEADLRLQLDARLRRG